MTSVPASSYREDSREDQQEVTEALEAPDQETEEPARRRRDTAKIRGVLLPVGIVLAIGTIFVSVYLAAFHAPKPHRMPVAVVGTAQQVLGIQAALDTGLPGGFNVAMYPSAVEAEHAIEHRKVYAAYIAPSLPATAGQAPATRASATTASAAGGPQLLYASANGPSVTSTLTTSFTPIAKLTGHPMALQDVLPSSAGDTRGLSVFYGSFGLIVAGFLFGLLTFQVAPRLPFRLRMLSVATFGVLGGVIIALIVGSTGYTAVPGSFVAIAGLCAMLAACAGLAAMVSMVLLRAAGMSVAAVVLLILGNSTSGGTMPALYLPGWLRPLYDVLPVGVGVRAIQGVSYFHDDGLGRGIAVLAAWIIACVVILYVGDLLNRRQAAVAA